MRPPNSSTVRTTEENGIKRLHNMIQAILRDGAHFDHPVYAFELIETHISYILLTGRYAYKFKKPVNPGFLDFSTLEKRKFYCEEELRLNRRLAPEFYLDVIPITGTIAKPVLGGEGPAIEYAVKMLQFPRGSELDGIGMRPDGAILSGYIDDLARTISPFHAIARPDTHSEHGLPEGIRQQVFENIEQLYLLLHDDHAGCALLEQIETWTRQACDQLAGTMLSRKQQGYVRECHGDLHLGNIAISGGKPVIFDCIEFAEAYRFIDVMNEIAFLAMDLDAHDYSGPAWRWLNTCLQISADYAGLRMLRFYRVYRALVRCKVICLKAKQSHPARSRANNKTGQYRRYLDLAFGYIHPVSPYIMITHGFSGSGKTTLSQVLLENPGAFRIRSDVERKRLHQMHAEAKSHSFLNSGIYTRSDTERTYTRLLELAGLAVDAGYPVIADATFLKKSWRDEFYGLARKKGVPFAILDCQADRDLLRARIEQRLRAEKDASEADVKVLDAQIEGCEMLDARETGCSIVMDMSVPFDKDREAAAIRKVKEFLGRAG